MRQVEFDCVDCKTHIYAVGLDAVPEDRRCAVCQWLVEFMPDEKKREAIRERLKQG